MFDFWDASFYNWAPLYRCIPTLQVGAGGGDPDLDRGDGNGGVAGQ